MAAARFARRLEEDAMPRKVTAFRLSEAGDAAPSGREANIQRLEGAAAAAVIPEDVEGGITTDNNRSSNADSTVGGNSSSIGSTVGVSSSSFDKIVGGSSSSFDNITGGSSSDNLGRWSGSSSDGGAEPSSRLACMGGKEEQMLAHTLERDSHQAHALEQGSHQAHSLGEGRHQAHFMEKGSHHAHSL
eukprot:scaffold145258_cov14-Tisochrysis_lutea.AAC.1